MAAQVKIICTSVFRNGDQNDLQKAFRRKWMELLHQYPITKDQERQG